jgi:DNA-binding CsgD family transcriptional regulator
VLARAGGESRRARALETRAAGLLSRFPDVWSPGLVTVAAEIPLTPREHEIAVMAAAGCTSQTIASALFLSVRTVSNHLQSIYSKTGAAGRSELAALMDPVRPTG